MAGATGPNVRLISELKRRNVFRMAVLYVATAWLIAQVAGELIDFGALPPATAPWILAALAVTGVMCAVVAVFSAYYYLEPSLPSVEELRDVQMQEPLRVYTRDGRLMAQIGEKRRTPVAYEDIPEVMVRAFLAAEDDRFFEHPGFDYQGITRAAINLARTGSRSQGKIAMSAIE